MAKVEVWSSGSETPQGEGRYAWLGKRSISRLASEGQFLRVGRGQEEHRKDMIPEKKASREASGQHVRTEEDQTQSGE